VNAAGRVLWLITAIALTVPGLVIEIAGAHLSPLVGATVYGGGILGAAFLLSWAAEVAQMEVSQAFALAILALIAILPEYAVDLYFAWRAAEDPIYGHYAAANMTGANRLLIGLGWSMVVWLHWAKNRGEAVELHPGDLIAVRFLGVATIYAFVIVAVGSFWWLDTVVLVGLFAWYLYRTTRLGAEEPELVGPALMISQIPRSARLCVNLGLFAYAGVVIFLAAEPFAEALIESGHELGIDEFFLVQWIAPLASEAPEFIIAALWTMRNHSTMALSALVSSKVNQWTLLIGTISLVYSISAGGLAALELDLQQRQEIFLTAAQSLFAVVLLADRRLTWWQAFLLFLPFAVQLVIPSLRIDVAIVYLVMTVAAAIRYRTHLLKILPGQRLPG